LDQSPIETLSGQAAKRLRHAYRSEVSNSVSVGHAIMAASQVCQLLKTNRQIEISGSGDFGEAYPDYSFEFASSEYRSNGLLRVEIVVKRRGSISPVDTTTIWVYDPDAKSVSNQPNPR
jgi:hypothetical protein